MDKTIQDASREQISAFLPEAIRTALNSYQEFSGRAVESAPREFKEHHMACKVAISHIDLLLKLAGWADLPDPQAPDHNNQIMLSALVQEAREELADYRARRSGPEGAETGEDEGECEENI
ncbi:MAG: hypothetical protein HYU57_03160 [Micavibrio aeruginosavorus]|nr:hypothetical protein [Micavibrio aeruginosavorus]